MKFALVAGVGLFVCMSQIGGAAAQSQAINVSIEQGPAEQMYCETLSDQYDRYSRYIDLPSVGRANWIDGTERCQQGKFADGEQLIIEAIRELGFAPLTRADLAARATQP